MTRKVRIIPPVEAERMVAAPSKTVKRSAFYVSGRPVTATQSWQRLTGGQV